MANLATTIYKITGPRRNVEDLWTLLQKKEVNNKNVWLGDLAEHYGIDYAKKGISVRGHIYWADFEADEANDCYLLSFETESAWSACDELFDEINRVLNDKLSISYREMECGCDIYYVHDEGKYFTEECCVSSSGEPFEDAFEDVYATIADAVKVWCEKTGIEQGNRTTEEMMNFINDYEYEDSDTYFYIHPFTFG